MIRTKVKKTVKDYMALPQEHGVELIEGEFVMSPSPGFRHQDLIANLLIALKQHADARHLGEVIVSPMDVILSDEIVLQPDLLFIRNERLGIIKDRVEGAPDLVIEILSPSTSDRDRFIKRDLYARFGVAEYWIVDPDARTIEVSALRGAKYELHAIFEQQDRLSTPLLPDLELTLATLWA
jgi:Uma2 family endonuclease